MHCISEDWYWEPLISHSVSSGRACQVVHKSQMSASKVVGAFLIIRHCMLLRQSMSATNDIRKASVHYNRLWSITESSSSALRCTEETINFDTPGDCGGHLSKVNSLSCSRNQSEMI